MNTERYQRQTILKGFGHAGQQKLTSAKVLVVGAGGLGAPVLSYLNAMGVGTLGIVDNDTVSLSNLHRQVLYTEKMIGLPKVVAAKSQLQAQNSNTNIKLYQTFLSISNALDILESYDIVVDATDNFPTRYLINDACVLLNKPFIYGALHGFEGQVSVFNYQNGPTYRCLFPKMPSADAIPNCNEHGVLGILPGIVGNLQALETIKVVTGIGDVLSGTLLLFDGLSQRTQRMKFSLNPDNKEIRSLATSYDFDCDVQFKTIEAIGVKRLMVDGTIELLDVRTLEEFQELHLQGATHIPLNELEKRAGELRRESPVYVICQSGIRSRKAILTLQKLFPESEFIQVIGGMNKIDSYANTY
ncbi:molybdopterin-synthase adenylyltransferase MoeB [Maribacter sp. X9]|uniref:molybdopterin-synthase adenylyltransferase MoeB n=1 Tax=Maribacter sp. X9 TaxID=3402159 RepID=UPI003AF39A87